MYFSATAQVDSIRKFNTESGPWINIDIRKTQKKGENNIYQVFIQLGGPPGFEQQFRPGQMMKVEVSSAE